MRFVATSMHHGPVYDKFKIFGHLEPLDVLRLARTSRDLRAILMSRASITVWIAARHKVLGLPECPNFLSEPAYADLAFCARCHVSRVHYVHTANRTMSHHSPSCRVALRSASNTFSGGIELDTAEYVARRCVSFLLHLCSRFSDSVSLSQDSTCGNGLSS